MSLYTAITQEGTVSLETRPDLYVMAHQDSNLRLHGVKGERKGG
jgi:hypothetical protein